MTNAAYWELVIDRGVDVERCDYDSLGGAEHAFRMACLTEPPSVSVEEWSVDGVWLRRVFYRQHADC